MIKKVTPRVIFSSQKLPRDGSFLGKFGAGAGVMPRAHPGSLEPYKMLAYSLIFYDIRICHGRRRGAEVTTLASFFFKKATPPAHFSSEKLPRE